MGFIMLDIVRMPRSCFPLGIDLIWLCSRYSRRHPHLQTVLLINKPLATSMESRSSNCVVVSCSHEISVSSSCSDVQNTLLGLGKQCRDACGIKPAYNYHHKPTRPQSHPESIVQLYVSSATFSVGLSSRRFSK